MGRKHDAKGRTRDIDRFTSIPNFVLASPAARTLQPSAFTVMVYLAMRCYGAKSNGKIVYGNRAGCLWFNPERRAWQEVPIGAGMSKSTIGRSLRELEQRGLIVCTKRNTFKQKRLAKEYRLTWIKTEDAPPTNEFLSFKSDCQKLKCRTVGGPVGAPIGPPATSTSSASDPKEALQNHSRAYSDAHRTTRGPLSNHSNNNSGVSEAVRGSDLARGAHSPSKRSAAAPAADLRATLNARLAIRKTP